MKFQQVLFAAAFTSVLASPVPEPFPEPQASESCKTDPLNQDTWNKLGIEKFLADFTAFNVSATQSNAIQNVAAAMGAPNFFCGLDNFCNAGQPCTPVKLPAWYALVAIQNWNSYMNSLNTAIGFASTIMGLTLPGIVKDFFPDPKDDVTEMKNIMRIFSGALSVIPFTGAINTAASAISGTTNFINNNVKAPVPTDRFLAWSDISGSLGKVVTQWQSAISTSIQTAIDRQANATGGIFQIIRKGEFLGSTGNITQDDMQKQITRSMELYTIGLTLQAQKVFIHRGLLREGVTCAGDGLSDQCVPASGGSRRLELLRRGSGKNAKIQDDVMNLLLGKYSMKKGQVLADVAACFDAAGGNQVQYPFGDFLPVDANTKCIFNLQVCNETRFPGPGDGIISMCEELGVDV